ncbi:MAG TPA: CpXC domain-containing protein [Kofleriaceae bacterium]
MSITRTDSFVCPCGATVVVDVVDSLNADRHPLLRQSVLDRRLHTATCKPCGRVTAVEQRFLYVDLERRQVLGVFPRNARTEADRHARHLQDTYERWFCTDASQWIRERAKTCLVRACFGLEELREKLVADEARVDDYRLELLKCILMAQDPRYEAEQVATLRLDRVTDDGMLELVPVDANDQPLGWAVSVPRDGLGQVPVEAMRHAFRIAVGPHVSMLRLAQAAR